MQPRVNPTSGEATIGMMTFSTMPDHMTLPPTPKSTAASVDPTRPPKSACDEEDGIPKYQVIKFQAIAPRTPASTTPRLARPVGRLTRPLPTVVATLPPRWAPMKLPAAAIGSATRGVSARVDTDVAIALAASWKPLV